MGLTEEINELKKWKIEKEIAEKSVEKKFRFPFGKKVGRGQKKRGFVTVLNLNENGTYVFNKYQILDQTVLHDLIPRLATAGHVMFDHKGNPLLILPNWSVEPFSPLVHYRKSLIEGSNTKGYKILLNKMKQDQVAKKGLGGMGKWLGTGFGIVILLIIGYAFLTGGA